MTKPFSYTEALRVLGAETPAIRRMDPILGGALLGAAALGFPQALALLDARSVVVELGQEVISGLRERLAGRSRYDRTQRIEAAHAVLVMTAFFSAFGELDLPFRSRDLKLTRSEQIRLTAPTLPDATRHEKVLVDLWQYSVPIPTPGRSFERYLMLLSRAYRVWAEALASFIAGLAVWDALDDTASSRANKVVRDELPKLAARRYGEMYRHLAVDVPEFAFWAGMADHQATRAEVRERTAELSTGLAGLEQLLLAVSERRIPAQQLAEISIINRAVLDRSIAEAGEAPGGLDLPTLAEAYINPGFRFAEVDVSDDPSAEEWWESQRAQPDMQSFLAGYLTGSKATDAPLVVLGQPGSGKSLLTKVLAARLPASDFLPIRVELRSVPADVPLQDQIEHAIRSATGAHMDWPALARSARGALPVVLLDGFDELLQATGVRRSDYLGQVSEFQRRESELGRPVAVIVTSRIAVADRVRFPEGSAALRLEPFNDDQIRAWVEIWNRVNASAFGQGDRPARLDSDLVLAHRELASQPLLLLMLALYDADGNALRNAGARIGQGEIYEQLLDRFVRREILKQNEGLTTAETDAAAKREMLRLSLAALAMFNRSRQWVTKDELDTDLSALLPERSAEPPGFRVPLSAAEVTLGRFFFVHRASATRHFDESALETYEFLHSTFGEYLVARFTVLALRDMAARQAAAASSPLGGPAIDDDLLYATLSHAALTARGAIISFLTQLLGQLGEEERGGLNRLALGLFRTMGERTGPGRVPSRAVYADVVRRYAHYGINLVLLILTTVGSLYASKLFTSENSISRWRDMALLWRAMCTTEEWHSLVDIVAVERVRRDNGRDIRLTLAPGWHTSQIDLYWSYALEPGSVTTASQLPHNIDRANRQAYFLCSNEEDLRLHALEPLLAAAPNALTTVHDAAGVMTSAGNILQRLWVTTSHATPDKMQSIYSELLGLIRRKGGLNDASSNRFLLLLLDRLELDARWLPPSFIGDILTELLEHTQTTTHRGNRIAQCSLAAIGRDHQQDRRLLELAHKAGHAPEILVRIYIAYAELDLIPVELLQTQAEELQHALSHVQRNRPQLVRRLRLALQETGHASLLAWPHSS